MPSRPSSVVPEPFHPDQTDPTEGDLGTPRPLSRRQRALWFADRLAPASGAYLIAAAARVVDALDPAALAGAIQALVERHPALRATFVAVDGEPVHRVCDSLDVPLGRIDCRGWSDAELDAAVGREAFRPFDLERGPLVRFTLFERDGAGDDRLVLSIHHLISDLWSLAVLLRELGALYGAQTPLPPLETTYWEMVEREEARLAGEEGERLVRFWTEELRGRPAELALPTDHRRRPTPRQRGGAESLRLDAERWKRLRKIGRSHRVNPFVTALAGLQALLHRLSGQDDVIVGTPTAGRRSGDLSDLVGYCVNPVAVRADASGDPTFGEFLERVRDTARRAFDHQDLPFPVVVERLEPEREASRPPIFQVLFTLQRSRLGVGEGMAGFALGEAGARLELGPLTFESLELEPRGAQFDLSVLVAEVDGELWGTLVYDRDLFERSTARRMADQLERLLVQVADSPSVRLSEIELLDAAERHQLLVEWGGATPAPAPAKRLDALLRHQAGRTPDAVALVAGDERLTYRQLVERSARLAERLRRQGVGPETRVGVCLPRGAELVVSLVAVLEAGGAYVPLDAAYPEDRLAFMLEDSGARVVIASAETRAALPGPGSAGAPTVVDPTDDGGSETPVGTPVPDDHVAPLAYVIYTSGSTGRPKGVAISHRSAAALVAWGASTFSPRELAGVLAGTSVSFDLSVYEIFLPLATGGRVILEKDALGVARHLDDDQVRLLNTVPSAMRELVAAGTLPASVETVNLAGEPLQRALVDDIYATFPGVRRVYNLYGPSEDTTYSTGTLVPRDQPGEPTIGRPVAGSRAYVLDRRGALVPPGVPGELCLAGPSLARGYLGRAAQTADRFVPDPHGETPGDRLYRTGDLARWIAAPRGAAGGELEYLGRLDHQVKVRGFRIELGEIEAALTSHERVGSAVVVVREAAGEKLLVGYVATSDAEAEVATDAPALDDLLRAHLAERLPAYMVPGLLVVLDELPLTPNGKVDRGALPEPELGSSTGEAPRTPTERRLAELFAEVLDLPADRAPGRTDDFFRLGGHSLLATRLSHRVRDALGTDLPVSAIFEAPTVAGLAQRLEAVPSQAISPRPDPTRAPLTFAQERLWFLAELEPDSPTYNMPGALRLDGRLSVPALAGALGAIVARHEPLRTELVDSASGPVQKILPASRVAVALPVIDLSALPAGRRESLAERLTFEESARPMRFDAAPLLRVRLLRLGDGEHRFVLVFHHMISDGWSLGVFVRELAALYGERLGGAPAGLPPLEVTYGDFALWQREQLSQQVVSASVDWWRDELAGAPAILELPTDRPRPPHDVTAGRTIRIPLERALVTRLTERGHERGATLFMVLLAGFEALLGRLSGLEQLTVGTVDAGRHRRELEDLIGFFVDTVPVRARLEGDPSLGEVVDRARRAVLGSFVHQQLPFDRLVHELDVERMPGAPPLIQALIALQNAPMGRLELPALEVERLAVDNGTAKFDLTLSFEPVGAEPSDGLVAAWNFSRALFDATTVRRMARQLETIYRAMAGSAEVRLGDLPLLGPAERHQALYEWSREPSTVAPGAGQFQELIWRHARRTPDAVALISETERLTFGALYRRALALAARVRRHGAGPETLVGLSAHRTADQVVGALGIVTAGAAYVPLDPDHPQARLEAIAREAELELVVAERAARESVEALDVTSLWLDDLAEPDADEVPALLAELAEGPQASPDNLAYAIFTSGSTGRPKGVAACHRSVTNRLPYIGAADPGGRGRGLYKCSIGFDLSVAEIYGPLAAGQAVVLARPGGESDMLYLLDLIEREGVAQAWFLPSQLSVLLEQTEGRRIDFLDGVITGAEAVPTTLPARFAQRFDCPLVNHYGPTETTVSVICWWIDLDRVGRKVPIGRPIAGAQVYLLDARLRPVPPGVPGEIVIGGLPVTRGYLRQPALTAEKFVPDPFADGLRAYRSGDLARRGPDGLVEFLGRIDKQVKVRGFRIELGEIEATLLRHPAVLEAVVLDFEDPTSENRRLAAFVVATPKDRPGVADLQAFLSEHLPGYMVPTAFELVDEMPLNPSAKVDRHRLPEPRWVRRDPQSLATAPVGAVEQRLATIFAEVLGVDEIGRDDDFFDHGGHSLLASRLVSRTRAAFGVELQLRQLFERPTVAGLARVLAPLVPTGAAGGTAAAIPPPLAPGDEPVRATFNQERLWFLDRLAPDSAAYNVPGTLRISGPLDRPALAGALHDIVERQEVLRTTFTDAGGGVVQRVHPTGPAALPLIDLSGLPAPRRRETSLELAAEIAARGFDLARGPVYRTALLVSGTEEHLLSFTVHHIVSDGWSVGVLVRELAAFYRARTGGTPAELPELPIRFGAFAAWQREQLTETTLDDDLAWWRQELAGASPVLELPTDRPRARGADGATGDVVRVALPGELAERLAARGREHGATLFMVLLAGFEALLGRLADSEDFVVGTVDAGRHRRELEELVGFFVDTLALRARLGGGPRLAGLIDRARESTLAALAHRRVPFDWLVRELAPARTHQPGQAAASTPLVQVLFSLQNLPDVAFELGDLRLERLPVESGSAQFDLAVDFAPLGDGSSAGLVGTWRFRRSLYDPTTIVRMARQLEAVYRSIAETPDLAVAEIAITSAAERHQVLVEWSRPDRSPAAPATDDDAPLDALVRSQAAATPDAVALVVGEARLTYGELAGRARTLARVLHRRGVTAETRVGVCLPRDADLVVALLAVLEAGGAYVPLDAAYPQERLAFMLEDSGARLVIADAITRGALPTEPTAGTPEVVDPAEVPEVADGAPLPTLPGGARLSHVIYTSGSTGRPKGVAISHGAARALLAWAADTYSTEELDGVLAGTSISFDLSVYELFLPLTTGGRVVLEKDSLGAARHREGDEIRLVNTVPSALRELVASNGLPASVRTVNLAGEPLQRALVDDIYRTFPDVSRVYNLYGPSEDTTYSTGTLVARDERGEPTIGRSVAGGRAFVLDRHLRPVAIGVPGQLCLAGPGLARGYLGRPARTAESFVPAPGGDGDRLYRTGDLARWRADGELQFLGRLDHQVKLRGFRIELGEIEAVLAAHDRVDEAVAAVRGEGSDGFLVGYVVARPGDEPLEETLREHLEARLPTHMVPALLMEVDALPLTPNGKVDRGALPDPRLEAAADSVAPRTETERHLADLFAEVLGLPEGRSVNVDEDFFRLGGHSLVVTRLTTEVRRRLGLELPVAAVFETPTVAALARRLEAMPATPIPPRPDPSVAPLSHAQERLWFLAQMDPDSSLYDMPAAVRLDGQLDLGALAGTLDDLVGRHEPLRTLLTTDVSGPIQRILEPGEVRIALPVVDLAALPEERRTALATELVRGEASRPIFLGRAPLVRCLLVRSAVTQHTLSTVFHHAISDGWSMGIFVRELGLFYEARVEGRAVGIDEVPALPVTYGDFALWQRRRASDEALAKDLDWWREELDGAPTLLEVPTDRPRPPHPAPAGALLGRRLPADLVAALTERGRDRGATLFMVLLAGFSALLGRLSGRSDPLVGTVDAGRRRQELEGLIGFFVDTLVLRGRLDGNPRLDELIDRSRRAALGSFAHQDLPFDSLVQEMVTDRGSQAPPLVQVMLALQNVPRNSLELAGLELEQLPWMSGTVKFDLSVSFEPVETDEGLELAGIFGYRQALFDATTVERMARQLESVYRAIAREPSLRLGELSLMSETERHQLLLEWNDEPWPVDPEGACLHDAIWSRAERNPDALAVITDSVRLTYGELRLRALGVAVDLRRRGVGPESLVGLCTERTVDQVVGALGILSAGGAYVPLDPAYPGQRLLAMVTDAGLDLVATQRRLADRVEGLPVNPLWLDELPAPDRDDLPGLVAELAAGPTALPDNAVYAIFTSGSTGRPKGVLACHRSVTNRLLWAAAEDPVGEGPGLLKASICFDLSVLEMFSPLVAGTTLVLARPGGERDMEYLLDLIEREQVAQASFLPSQLSALLEQQDCHRLASLTGMMTGGETVPPTLPERFAARLDCPLYNRYGPTETTLSVTSWASEAERDVQTIPIGRRIGGADIYLFDAALRPVPLGVPGELVIGGVAVTRGYLGRPEATAEKFVPDPFRPGERMYKSGDLARWRQDGVIEFLGRIDQQVKVRGFRIELGEIEAVLVQHPAVLEAAVIDCDEPGTDDRRLAAFVILEPDVAVEAGDLLAFVGTRLPAYMVPVALDILDRFPLNSSGKVDRRRLPEPTWVSDEEREIELPRGATEERLAELFADVLGVERIGRSDDFFEQGGHSLLATRLVSRVRATFGIELALRRFFEVPTVAGLGEVVDDALAVAGDDGPASAMPPLLPAPGDAPARASFAQERLWFLARLDPDSAAYHMPGAVRIEGRLRPAALSAALGDVVHRHEALRTVFEETREGVLQRVLDAGAPDLPVVDLSHLPDRRRQDAALGLALGISALPFDLGRGPLVRVALVRLAREEHLLTLTLHHIVSDGWSIGVMIRELAAFYGARVRGEAAELPELPVQYGDFSTWQRSWLQGDVLEERLGWWRDLLDGAPPVLDLPHDRPRPPVQTFRSASVEADFGAGSLAAVAALARRLNATPFTVVLAALATVLGRLSGQDDLVVGSPSAGRTQPQLEGLIGLFVNTLALRVDLSGSPSFGELVARVRGMSLEAQAREDLPFEQLVEAVAPGRDLATTPLFQVMLAYQNIPRERLELPGAHLSGIDLPSATAKFDLTVAVAERDDRLVAQLEHNRDLFDTVTIERLVRQLATLLAAATERPDEAIARLPLATDAERHLLLDEWGTGAASPADDGAVVTLHDFVARQADRTPQATALVCPATDDGRLSYRNLLVRSRAVAAALVAEGVGAESRVGVYLGRSADAVTAILGVLQAGAAYVALDPGYPAERVAFMIEDSAAQVVITDAALGDQLPLGEGGGSGRAAPRVLDAATLAATPTTDFSPPTVEAEQLAYLIYTSGSTGRPKGVAIPHRAATAMVRWARGLFPADALGGVLAATSFCFDLSVYELFVPLATGGTVVLAQDALELAQLGQQADHPVRLLNTVPSAARQLLAMDALPASLQVVNLAGEPLDRALADAIHEALPGLDALYNLYGPSEDTTYSTAFRVPRGATGEPAIGRPIDGTRALVVDAAFELCPIGVPGELLLAGDGLARGYLGRPAQTAASFVPDPFGTAPGGRLYRTGDRVRWVSGASGASGGQLDFLGRLDRQVKVRGFRVELGEIETVLARHPGVSEAAVIVRQGSGGLDLAAYVCPEGDVADLPATLRAFLAERLPGYMVPAYLVELPQLPHTPNGKVDRKALPDPTGEAGEAPAGGERLAPETELELVLAEFWAEVLEVDPERIDIRDDFFDHGGHSLKATQLLLRVRDAFEVAVPVRRFLQQPTLVGLSEAIGEILLAEAEAEESGGDDGVQPS